MVKKGKKIKKAVNKAIESLPRKLLEFFQGFDEYYSAALMGRAYHHKWLRQKLRGQYNGPAITTALHRLQKSGLITKKRTDDKVYYQLTIDGELKQLINHAAKHKTPRTDGFATVIVFDIAEDKRRHRRFLRKFLLNNGFTNLQKSVMIGPVLLPKEFQILVDRLRIAQNVTILKAKIENWQ